LPFPAGRKGNSIELPRKTEPTLRPFRPARCIDEHKHGLNFVYKVLVCKRNDQTLLMHELMFSYFLAWSSSERFNMHIIYKRRQKGTWCTWSQIPDPNVNTCNDNEWNDLIKILYRWNQHWTRHRPQHYNCTAAVWNTNDNLIFVRVSF